MPTGQRPQVVHPVFGDFIRDRIAAGLASMTYPEKTIDACYFSIRPVYTFMELKGIVVEHIVARMTFIVSL
jgi:hypothetical protein